MKRPDGTVEGVRRANASRVLRLVHTRGPLSRADLTALTGLNRSTVGALVADLATAGLAIEGAAGSLGRVGRPSPSVSASPDIVTIAVNPEVDAVTVAAVALDRSVIARERIEVDADVSSAGVAALTADVVEGWRGGGLRGRRIVGAGAAVPGLVSRESGLVSRAPHLNWTDAPLRNELATALGVPAAIDNDATLGALAESLYGAGRDVADLLYLNGGASGIGGGIVIGGQIVRGADGFAGEVGHNRAVAARAADRRAGENGALEDEVSRARLLAAVGLHSADEPTLDEAIRSAASPEVSAEVERQRGILAAALATVAHILNPSMIVLGGFLATILEQDAAALRRALAHQAMPVTVEGLELRAAALGANRLLVGAAELAFAALLEDPLAGG